SSPRDADGAGGDDLVGAFARDLDGDLARAESLVRQFGAAFEGDVAAHVQGLLDEFDVSRVAVGVDALGNQADLAAQGGSLGLPLGQVLDQQDAVIHTAVARNHIGAADAGRGAARIGRNGLDQAGDAGGHVGNLFAQLLGAGGLFLLVLPRLLDFSADLVGLDGQAL